MHTERRVVLALTTAVLVAGMLVVPAVAQQACTQVLVYDEVGETHEFVVPDDVEVITFDVWGAQGGSVNAAQNPGSGGLGGAALGVAVDVTPGETLLILVGGQGGDVAGDLGSVEANGGFNGGGDGGVVNVFHGGAGGGGASSVIRETGSELLITVGGGGGGAHGGSGGHGGGVGTDGDHVGTGDAVPGQAGGDGGAGGAGDGATGQAGATGTAGQGGAGGDGGDAGGGGGGGAHGGGGGGGGDGDPLGGGAGGGGGSSSGPDGTVFETGVREGDGQVDLTWTDPACGPDLTVDKTSDAEGAVQPGDRVVYTITVTNSGEVDLEDVSVADPLLDELVCDPAVPAALPVGASIVCVGEYVATTADADAGEIVNVATATGTDPNDPEVAITGEDHETIVVEQSTEPPALEDDPDPPVVEPPVDEQDPPTEDEDIAPPVQASLPTTGVGASGVLALSLASLFAGMAVLGAARRRRSSSVDSAGR